MSVFRLGETLWFPSPEYADVDGLLAVDGDLLPDRLLLAYSMGIFPWYSEGLPILWWSPDPRLVLFPQEFHLSKRLDRLCKKKEFQVTLDQAFREVIQSCSQVHHETKAGTWIVPEMIEAYCELHELGYAHSVETWQDDKLVGGLYGVSLGRVFFGESMFHLVPNASKVAMAKLVEVLLARGFELIDCQVTTKHLISLGAREIRRSEFLRLLAACLKFPIGKGKWHP